MLIFLSGSKDSGKTATARCLRRLIPNLAVVEPDAFFPFFPETASTNADFNEIGIKCVELGALAARELHTKGYTVLIAYPLSTEDYERFMKHLRGISPSEIAIFTLVPSKEAIYERINRHHKNVRYLEHRRQNIERHYQEGAYDLGIVRPQYPSILIDNSNVTALATAKRILRELEKRERQTEEQVHSKKRAGTRALPA
jgi:hypothetical protein